jgi:PPOX class probable F420-dependent enzyme
MAVTIQEAIEFTRTNHRAILSTRRRDGRPQMSPIAVTPGADGTVLISTRETAVKAKNVERDPNVSVCVITDGWYGDHVQLDGTATILRLPDAMEPLVEYYRSIAGEHSDWDDYRAAMTRERRVLLQITVTSAGPNASG